MTLGGPSNRPSRRVSSSRERYAIRAYTEGETEVQYLNAWNRVHRTVSLQVDATHGVDPLQLVQDAVKHKQHAAKDARRGRGSAPDSYWCIFDTDDFDNIPEAIALAEEHGINVAISNPCIELWLFLHVSDHQRWEHRKVIQKELKKQTGIHKTLSVEHLDMLLKNYEVARDRAQALEKMHDNAGHQGFERNPSTAFWLVVEEIRHAG